VASSQLGEREEAAAGLPDASLTSRRSITPADLGCRSAIFSPPASTTTEPRGVIPLAAFFTRPG